MGSNVLYVEFSSYFGTISAFAGVVFGLSLVARHMTEAERKAESANRNEFRKWDSMSVIFELAGAGLLSALALIAGRSPEGWIATAFACFVSGVGLNLYRHYLCEFRHLRKLDRSHAGRATGSNVAPEPALAAEDRRFAGISVLPIGAYVASVLGFLAAAIFGDAVLQASLAVIAGSVAWLAFSGTYQAMYWYQRSWERPPSDTAGATGDPEQPALPATPLHPTVKAEGESTRPVEDSIPARERDLVVPQEGARPVAE